MVDIDAEIDDRSSKMRPILNIVWGGGSGTFASRISWAANWFLLFSKIIIVVFTNSKSVTAALADSAGILI